MRIRILGCSGGIGSQCGSSSYLLDDTILIDAGTGLSALTTDEMRRIRHVFLTHSHLDHLAALPLLVDTIFEDLKEPLVVHAQEATIEAMSEHLLNWTIWPDFAELPNKHSPVMVYEPMAPGDVATVDGKTFEMFPGDHVVPSVAFYVSDGERSFCYSGDTTTNDTIWEGLNGKPSLDLLLVECAFPNRLEELCRLAKHYCPSMLAADLAKLNHRPLVGITHLKPGDQETTWRECEEAIEGFEFFRVDCCTEITVGASSIDAAVCRTD